MEGLTSNLGKNNLYLILISHIQVSLPLPTTRRNHHQRSEHERHDTRGYRGRHGEFLCLVRREGRQGEWRRRCEYQPLSECGEKDWSKLLILLYNLYVHSERGDYIDRPKIGHVIISVISN